LPPLGWWSAAVIRFSEQSPQARRQTSGASRTRIACARRTVDLTLLGGCRSNMHSFAGRSPTLMTMRTLIVVLLTQVILPGSTEGQGAPTDLRAKVSEFVQAHSRQPIELIALGTPVPAASCKVYDRSKGLWVSLYQTGIAVHVRYRTRDRFGTTTVESKIAFVDPQGTVQGILQSGSVRSSDLSLMK
jgi:hypothetical protein